jgi:hypothetical protein
MFLDVTLNKRLPETIQQKETKPLYDWRYENSINNGKDILELENQEFKYEKWRTVSTLSNYVDTIFYANEMNLNHQITDKMHYDYLFYSVRKAKRFNKKKTDQDKKNEQLQKEEQDKIALLQDFYKYNVANAKAALKVLTGAQIESIRKRLEKGGAK